MKFVDAPNMTKMHVVPVAGWFYGNF